MKPLQSHSLKSCASRERLLEDRSKKNALDAIFAGTLHILERVTGDRDNGRISIVRSIKIANLSRGRFVAIRREVHAVCAGRDGNVEAGVDQKFRWAGSQGNSLKDLARESSAIGGGQ